jgi:hypothetical protein
MAQVFLVFILIQVCLFVAEQNGIQEGLETNYFQSVQTCTTAADCHYFAECIQSSCRCKSPFQGDGVTYCTVGGDFATEEFITDKQFVSKVQPQFLCWTNAQAGQYWNAYLSYTVSSTVIIPLNVSSNNVVSFPGIGGILQPNQTTLFFPGRHLAFKISSSKNFPFAGFTWTLSGLDVVVTRKEESDWYSRECPSSLTFSIPVTIQCPAQNNLNTTLANNFKTLLDDNKSKYNLQSNAETVDIAIPLCAADSTVLNTAISITVNTDPQVKSTGIGSYAMDIVWNLLLDSTVARIFEGTSVKVVPKAMRDIAVVDTSKLNTNPFVTLPPPPPNPKDINLFGYPSSYFTFALFLTAIIFALCALTILLGCLCWCCTRKKDDVEVV